MAQYFILHELYLVKYSGVQQSAVLFWGYFRKFLVLILLLGFQNALLAQLCNGSLGDPAVNITFGTGADNNHYVPSAAYTYTTSTCPDDGFYTITKNTFNCFSNSWHTLNNDHTGGGAFMLVNASYTPGDFFVTTVTDLCPNTTYEFAAWIMNVMKNDNSILPNLTFNVETPDGVVLNTFSTGDIPITASSQWKQYGFYFATPVGNPIIVLRITNNAPGGIGNDLALDDITFRPCGSKIDANITGQNTQTVDLCETPNNGETFNLYSDISAGYTDPLFQWQQSRDEGKTWTDISGATGNNYITAPVAGTGSYWYRMSVTEKSVAHISSCRISSEVLKINVHSNPITDAGPDRIVLSGNPVVLSGSAEGDQLSFAWTPDLYINDAGVLSPTVTPETDMTYTLTARSVWGCVSSDDVYVKAVSGIYVPTAFTPNGDGLNDQWKIPFLDPSFGGEVSVYNRWGKRVYHVSSAPVSWDGRWNGEIQPAGVYAYYIIVRKYNLHFKGTINLIR